MLEEDDNFVSVDVYITPPSQGEVTMRTVGLKTMVGTVETSHVPTCDH